MKIVINVVLVQYILCYFGYFLQLTIIGGIGAYIIYFCGYLRNMFTRATTIY